MKCLLMLITLSACAVATYAVLRPIHQAETLRVKEVIIVDGNGPAVTLNPAGVTFTDASGTRTTVISPGVVSVGEGGRMRRIEYSGETVETYEGR